jgi:hypothetical protein
MAQKEVEDKTFALPEWANNRQWHHLNHFFACMKSIMV